MSKEDGPKDPRYNLGDLINARERLRRTFGIEGRKAGIIRKPGSVYSLLSGDQLEKETGKDDFPSYGDWKSGQRDNREPVAQLQNHGQSNPLNIYKYL